MNSPDEPDNAGQQAPIIPGEPQGPAVQAPISYPLPLPVVPKRGLPTVAIVAIVLGSVVALVCVAGLGVALFAGAKPAATSGPQGQAVGTTAAPITLPPTQEPSVAETTPPSTTLPADLTYTGRGAKVVKLKLASDHVHIATITHQGSGNFAVWSVDSAGENIDLIVNEIGKYSGVRPLDFVETPAALKIEANGTWRVVVRVAEKAPVWTGTTSGKGPAVLRIGPGAVDGLATIAFTHTGSSNFAVWAYGDSRDLLINEIGKYSGETLLPSGTVLVEIEADGAWTFKKT